MENGQKGVGLGTVKVFYIQDLSGIPPLLLRQSTFSNRTGILTGAIISGKEEMFYGNVVFPRPLPAQSGRPVASRMSIDWPVVLFVTLPISYLSLS